jgi:hypothetical protein
MKKFSLLLLLLFSSNLAFTQKIDLDKFNFKASYLQLPTNPFPEEYTTFSTKFVANGINLNDAGFANGESDLASTYFKISGFKRVNSGGHFTIKVQIDGYDMGKPETVKKETTTKDKDGKETTTISYTLKFKYLVPMMYTITDLNGKILKDGPIAEGSIEKTYETGSYSTTAALEKYWNDNAASTKRGLLGGFISEKLSLFQNRLDNEIGYVPRTTTDILWTTDSPKHPENDAFKKACEDTKLAMAEMTVTVPLNPAKVKPIIAYYDSVLVKYNKDEKPERKLRYGAWYNMATIYYWLEDYDNATRCSEGLITNDYDKSDGKSLKVSSEKMKSRMANSRIKSIHYVRDVSNAVAPEMTQAQKDEEVAQQNASKDKAMREAAEREVASQRRTSSGSNGMLDIDKSINAIGNLLGSRKKKESNIVFDQPLAELVNAMNETLWNYQLIMKSMSLKSCPNNTTMEMLGQFDSFKKQFEAQKSKLDKSTTSKIRAVINSYEIFMEKEVMASYIMPSDPQKIQQLMANAISMIKEQNGKALDNITNENDDKNVVLLLLSELQKSLNYGIFPLYGNEEQCIQQAFDLAMISYKRLKTLEEQSKLSPEIKAELKNLLSQYSPLFQSEKSKIMEAQNTKLIESINKNEYPKFVLNLLQN